MLNSLRLRCAASNVSACVAAILMIAGTPAATVQAQRPVTDGVELPALVMPARRAPDAPPVAPTVLPVFADRVVPLTIDGTVERPSASGATTAQQTITRTADRIHISVKGGSEWLFERNPRDPRRVSASLIDHASRAIVLYEESDLRIALGIQGWADVLTLGFDPLVLRKYERTREEQAIGDVRFALYTAHGSEAAGDVWWSEEHAFPSRFTRTDPAGLSRFSVRRVRTGAEPAVLQVAEKRFPQYRLFNLSDWLERH